MKVLSIGNSFSQDAHRYLHRLAKLDGTELKDVNLYIGGCSLERHYQNMLLDSAVYSFEFNGEKTGIKVSIRQALLSDSWDIITLQQVSHLSVDYSTFSPYIEELSKYVRECCPEAKLLIHQTWAYQDGGKKLMDIGYTSAKKMLSDFTLAYRKAIDSIGADGVIPCGDAMMRALDLGLEKVHRDGFHASLGAGRYLLALCWYKALTGKNITNNNFDEFDEPVTEKERKIIIKAVDSILNDTLAVDYILK